MNQEVPEHDNTINRFMTVKRFCLIHDAFSEGGIRHLIFHEESNGFHGAFPRLGRRRLIDVPKFFDRISQNSNEGKSI